jgi:hypothetical protein
LEILSVISLRVKNSGQMSKGKFYAVLQFWIWNVSQRPCVKDFISNLTLEEVEIVRHGAQCEVFESLSHRVPVSSVSLFLPGCEVSGFAPQHFCCQDELPFKDSQAMGIIVQGQEILGHEPKQTFSLCKLIILGICYGDEMLTNPCTTLCEINKFILLNLIIYS